MTLESKLFFQMEMTDWQNLADELTFLFPERKKEIEAIYKKIFQGLREEYDREPLKFLKCVDCGRTVPVTRHLLSFEEKKGCLFGKGGKYERIKVFHS